MRPIDADALLKWLSEWELQEAPWWGANGYGDAKVAETIKEAIDAVEQMPTIDAVPVVRCKDCKHKPIDTGGKGYGEDLSFDDDYKCPCKCEDPFYSWMPEDDWFCANGERSK